MQAIKTKFLPFTDKLGERIVASCANGKIRHVMAYQYDLDLEANHVEAAKQLRKKLNWYTPTVYGPLVWGQFGNEYFFVPTVKNGSDRSF